MVGVGWVVFESSEDANMAKDYYNLLANIDPKSLYVSEHGKKQDAKSDFDKEPFGQHGQAGRGGRGRGGRGNEQAPRGNLGSNWHRY